ncbi:MAG: hypothetical protein JEZ02_15645 [Desulfatibacillum sp.]|nr:hypothetical protein [Desulfatibacillum sp.]
MKEVLEALEQAIKRKIIVQLGRHELEEDDYFFHGFVMDYSETFVLMQLVSDRFDLDGYEVLRTKDITFIDSEFPERRFLEKALTAQGVRPTPLKGIDLSGARPLFKSIEKQFPLLVIHREWVSDDDCEVGRIKLAADEFYTLKNLSPTARWVDDDKMYRYSDVTRVCFGGAYETTLALVAEIQV